MAGTFSQADINTTIVSFLEKQETKLTTQIDDLKSKTEPPSQTEMLGFQLAMQAYTFMGQFASSVQKELHEAVKAIVSRL